MHQPRHHRMISYSRAATVSLSPAPSPSLSPYFSLSLSPSPSAIRPGTRRSSWFSVFVKKSSDLGVSCAWISAYLFLSLQAREIDPLTTGTSLSWKPNREHMLFYYASEKYPLEDGYSKYIAEHVGMTNAFTSSEHTNFFFEPVNNGCFEEALDRFAQFFIKPLMSPDATLREIKAVDSASKACMCKRSPIS